MRCQRGAVRGGVKGGGGSEEVSELGGGGGGSKEVSEGGQEECLQHVTRTKTGSNGAAGL